jgi:hypothetical protein
MSSRYLGVMTLERFLVAERYCESRPPSSTDPQPTPSRDRGDRRGRPGAGTGAGAPGPARHR